MKPASEKNGSSRTAWGGYSGSSIIDAPMRRHHGLLIASLHPPVKRFLILSKLNERITIGDTTYPMHTTKYSDRIIEGYKYLQHFSYDTYPIYTYEIKDTQIQKEVLLKYGTNSTIIKYTLKAGKEGMTFVATPCFNFKPHGEQGMKTDLSFEVKQESNNLLLIPKNTYAQKEEVKIQYRVSEGDFIRSSNLFDDRIYLDFEFETGSEGTDAHYTPYHHQVTLAPDEEKCVFIQCEVAPVDEDFDAKDIALEGYFLDAQTKHETRMKQLVLQAEAKHKLLKRLALSADQFICTRNSTGSKTVLAGLPWFTDWGRDTMIALCGLTLSTNRFDVAKEILRSFSKYENNGLLPNVFPDEDTKPMYNSVDASLWYFQAIYQYYRHTKDLDFIKEIYPTLEKVYDSFVEGTDFSIYMDDDCLIHAGSGLDQVTWMDVRINGVCVTPRHGKPVEINALWYNASMIMDRFSKSLHRQNKQYLDIAAATKASFTEKFINPDIQGLNDVVDPIDSSFRPNQIYAVSLPFPCWMRSRVKWLSTLFMSVSILPMGCAH